MFTIDEESFFLNYLKISTKMYYRLITIQVKKLAYQYAISKKKNNKKKSFSIASKVYLKKNIC